MSFVDLKAFGSGVLRFRLEIEGWAEEWVTDASVTHSGGLQGRTVRVGLVMEGVRIRDRSILHEASCEADGVTFKIRPEFWTQQSDSTWDDPATASFTKRVMPAAYCTTSLTSTAMTMPSLVGAGSLANSTYYHINTETIYVTTWPAISARARWGTTAQAHPVTVGQDALPAPIWADTPTMEGRRAYLYAYGESDSISGDGTAVWRGVVLKPPSLASDGVTWEIHCGPITGILAQDLAGNLDTAHVVGIYHHAACSVRLEVVYDATESGPVMLVGWHVDESAMLDWINDSIADLLGTIGTPFLESLRIERVDGTFRLHAVTTSSTAKSICVSLSSPIIGGVALGNPESSISGDYWFQLGSRSGVDGYTTKLSASSEYFADLSRPNDYFFNTNVKNSWEPQDPLQPCSPLGYAYQIMRLGPKRHGLQLDADRWQTADAADKAANPPWRIYVDRDMSAYGAIAVSGTDKPGGVFPVLSSGNDSGRSYYVDVEPWTAPPLSWNVKEQHGRPGEGFLGALDASSEVHARQDFGTGTVGDFVEALKDLAITDANSGTVPFITQSDLDSWALEREPRGAALALRSYAFYSKAKLLDVLRQELRLVNHFMRIGSDGRVTIKALPALTNNVPCDATHTIGASDIITPADSYGAWPTWEPQRDGRITAVSYQLVYDSLSKEWIDPPKLFQDQLAVAITKTRGKSSTEIKPFSQPAPGSSLWANFILNTIVDAAHTFLSVFARDYDVIRIAVPWTKFDVLCGDVVSVSHHTIPDGTGLRGLVSRRGVVIERSWDMDPGGENHGWLTIMLVQREAIAGYAPSAWITAHTNTSGNTWSITCSVANSLNVAWSYSGDGNILQHFSAGDYVRVVRFDDRSAPNEVKGQISGTPDGAAGTCVVVFDAVWTPGAYDWVLEFQEDTGNAATNAQTEYAYVADSTLTLEDGSKTRVFS